MLDVEGFILVGGNSSRMGKDKSQLMLGGRTTVDWVAQAMSSVVKRTSLVGSHFAREPLPHVRDLVKSWGPLGGIQAALHAATADWCLVIACDFPFVTSELLERLLSYCAGNAKVIDAVVPIQPDGYPQPLCAVYKRLPCLVAADQAIANEEHSPRALLDRVTTRYVEFAELSDLQGSQNFFFNLNTPETFERAVLLMREAEQ